MTEALTRNAFADQLDTTFTLFAEGLEPFEVRLESVSELVVGNGAERFSLVFRGPKEFVLRQGTYRLEHQLMGSMEILLVPVGRDEHGTEYEAIFNRLKT